MLYKEPMEWEEIEDYTLRTMVVGQIVHEPTLSQFAWACASFPIHFTRSATMSVRDLRMFYFVKLPASLPLCYHSLLFFIAR